MSKSNVSCLICVMMRVTIYEKETFNYRIADPDIEDLHHQRIDVICI